MPALTLRELFQYKATIVPSYIGTGFLPQNGKIVLAGPAGFGKSTFIANLAYDCAAGWNVWAHPQLTCPTPLKVLFMSNENSYEDWSKKFQLLHEVKKGPDYILDNALITVREPILLARSEDGSSKLGQNIQEWLTFLEQYKPNIVILDPLATFHDSEENSNSEMKRMCQVVDDLIELSLPRYGVQTSFIVTHHFKKRDPDKPITGADVRGASRLVDWADTRLLLDEIKGHAQDGVYHNFRRLIFLVIRQSKSQDDAVFWIDPCSLVPLFSHEIPTTAGSPFE